MLFNHAKIVNALKETSFSNFFDSVHFKEKFGKKVKFKASRGLDGVTPSKFSENLDSNIKFLLKKIRSEEYKFTPFLEKIVSKGKGKFPRIISIPCVKDNR